MPLIATRGAASAQGFGEFAQAAAPVYIEDVFSTWLYTGNGSTQTITNNIDLSTKGGLVWIKDRTAAYDHQLYDTARGANKTIRSNLTNAEQTYTTALTSFNTNGFSLGSQVTSNNSGDNIVSWTFREQPKFFDVVTYTGNASSRTISHNLGSVPGTIIVKCTSEANDWVVYHRSFATPASSYLKLNTTDAVITGNTNIWDNTAPTSSVFSVGASGFTNNSGQTYVAYLFAHDAGGFGDAGSDNVISCGSFTTSGTGEATVTLNYEPQWLLLKPSSTTGNWLMVDTMRGWNVNATGNIQRLRANLSDAEDLGGQLNPTSTGFKTSQSGALVASHTYIYIAIRRGPMKIPTSGTSVFTPALMSTDPVTVNYGFPLDLFFSRNRSGDSFWFADRLRGITTLNATTTFPWLPSTNTNAEGNYSGMYLLGQTSVYASGNSSISGNNATYAFRRAPGFFDEVCYTGNGGGLGTTVPHNLGVLPELIIVRARSGSGNWWVAHKDIFFNGILNLTDAWNTFAYNASISFSTATQLSTAFSGNTNGVTFVAYLFASVAGVSKVGSYTGTGALQTVNCGFTGGARFILIKRTDSTGDWWVYDSARGISSGNDPYLFMNSTAAEVTNTNYVDTTSVGFQVTAAAPAGLNANGGTYIFLAIA